MSRNVGIGSIISYIPGGRKNLYDYLSKYNITREFIEKKTGYTSLACKSKGESTLDMANKALEALFVKYPNLSTEIGLLVVITQNPGKSTVPHLSALLHGRTKLSQNVAAFDISLGCSGWVYGLSIVKSFMESNAISSGVLITADSYCDIIDYDDRNTSLIFGDAATATLLSDKDVLWDIGKFVFGTEGQYAEDLCIKPNGMFHMNGRSIFNFAVTKLPACVMEAINRNSLDTSNVDRIILHQAGRYIVESIGERLNLPQLTPFPITDIGNTISSSIPLVLSAELFSQDINIITAGFGVGLSWAATSLKKRV